MVEAQLDCELRLRNFVGGCAGLARMQVEIDQRSTLPEVRVRFEAIDEAGLASADLAKHLRVAFQMRIEVETVANGVLPVFEFKARRWKILK